VNIPRKNLPAEERRAVTIEAVIALAGTQNPSDITTAAIAKHMNLTQGALFRHFPTKDALWQSVMEWVAVRLLARLDAAEQGIASPLGAMHAMFMGHLEFVLKHPGVPRMLFGQLQTTESTAAKRMAQTLLQGYAERLRTRIDAGKALGEISPEIQTQAAAALFIGTIQGLVMQSLLSNDLQHLRNEAAAVYAIYERGLRTA
jgi:TetR/AcrR family transcriptional regulator